MNIETFCVKSADLTDNELNIMLEKCVELGAKKHEWIAEFIDDERAMYFRDDFKYWGVDNHGRTVTSDVLICFKRNLTTKEQAFKMLGIANSNQAQKPTKGSNQDEQA